MRRPSDPMTQTNSAWFRHFIGWVLLLFLFKYVGSLEKHRPLLLRDEELRKQYAVAPPQPKETPLSTRPISPPVTAPLSPEEEVRRNLWSYTVSPDPAPRHGDMERLGQDNRITERRILADAYDAQYFGADNVSYAWAKIGADHKVHFANSFLKGFLPFKTANPWLAYLAVSLQVAYVTDMKQFGLLDIWLTSVETYSRQQGDCEDHALLLADWLNTLGYDARVVRGEWGKNGHVWVVLFEGKEVYLLEATNKHPARTVPFARLMPEYEAEYMFNQDYAWFNLGGPKNLDYLSPKWVKVSRFVERKPKAPPVPTIPKIAKSPPSLPEPPTPLPPTPPPLTTAPTVRILARTYVMSSPKYVASSIAILSPGKIVTVLEVRGAWLKLALPSQQIGYILRQDAEAIR